MRRKGKPKAKTKLASTEASPSSRPAARANDCDTGPTAQAPPRISISIAPADRADRTAGASSDPEQRPTSGQPAGRRAANEAPADCVILFDAASETTSLTVIGLHTSAAHKDETPEPAGGDNLASGVVQVRSSYLELIRANSLHYLHLGAFIYSLSLALFSLVFVLRHKASGWLAAGLASPPAERPPQAPNSNTTSQDCDSREQEASFLSMKMDIQLAWLLLEVQLTLTLLQLACIGAKLYLDQSAGRRASWAGCGSPPARAARQTKLLSSRLAACLRRPHARQLEAATVCLSLAQLLLPSCLIQRHHCQQLAAAPPVILSCLLVYSWPLFSGQLLAGQRAATKLRNKLGAWAACLVVVVPLVLAHAGRTVRLHPSSDGELALVLVSLLAGLSRARLLARLHRRGTFKGATELIEAKVSLEQQRQQQETLLLSVLPAYVAEQVKRNMLKKMDSLRDEDEPHEAGPEPAHQQQLLPASCSVATTAAAVAQTVHGPAHCVRSLTLHNAAGERQLSGGPQGAGSPAGQQCQRHQSLASRSRLSSSLASRAAHLRELLALNGGNSGASASKRPSARSQLMGPATKANHAIAAHEQQAAPANCHPAAGQQLLAASPVQQHQSRRGFNELYIRTYNNVSLLYGDIVGFTRLCTQLSSSQLVRVLNNLFSYFDHLAEQHRIMRIKILGDCYYGVSGIPEFAVMGAKSGPRHHHHKQQGPGPRHAQSTASLAGRPAGKSPHDNHAINCVNMGLNMIQYIKSLNLERAACGPSSSSGAGGPKLQHQDSSASNSLPANLELNMRIGVHTGHIHSGVIGLKKWQFDVWSNDVSVAMHCESSGVAGRVQVTEATCQHLRNAFSLELAGRSTRDTYLSDKGIRTYLIKERARAAPAAPGPDPWARNATGQRRSCSPSGLSAGAGECNSSRSSVHSLAACENMMQQELHEDKIREATLGTIRQTLLAGEQLAAGRGAPGLGSYGLARLSHNDMHWLSLEFREAALERQFKSRLISTWHCLASLLALFLLLVVAPQLALDRAGCSAAVWLGLSSGQQLAASLLLTGLLVLVAIMPAPRRKSAKLAAPAAPAASSSTSSPCSSQKRSTSTSRQRHSSRSSTSSFQQQQPPGAQLDPSASQGAATLAGDFVARTRAQIERVLQMNSVRKHLKRHANNRLSCCAMPLFFALVLVGQFYAIKQEFCLAPLACDSARRLHQASVLLVLMAIDLSPALVDHKLRFSLLLLLATVQLLALFAGNPFARPDASSLYQRLVARRLASWACGGGGGGGGGEEFARPQQAQSVIYWSCDGLLLVLSLWSLAFSRQLEFAQRCNFLWRNRLNVDHEELEYISGINKVLLENILPSHVVQHYLAQASSGHQAADSSGPTHETPVCAQEQEVATKRKADSSTPPGCSSGGSQQQRPRRVRMSVSCQMRNLNGGLNSDELYHEQHESVAVMFASIPHFYEFYDESDISKQGLGCIALLNEIICDFDKLLLKNKFSRIEKIKTIGSTYMAAAGLRPCSSPTLAHHQSLSGRNSTASQVSCQPAGGPSVSSSSCTAAGQGRQPPGDELPQAQGERRLVLSQQKMNLICMIQFATSLMSALNGINKQSFQVFKLRVGVNTGPVIAGIIGAQRPFYDIWGDCVNIASRMESLGEVGRIQVEERTAKLLLECLCAETYAIRKRGPIDVKGKGGMVTYFVDRRQQQQHSSATQAAGSPEPWQQQRHNETSSSAGLAETTSGR